MRVSFIQCSARTEKGQFFECHERFKESVENAEHDERSGRPRSHITYGNV
jgi:hypothetical protein